MVDILVVWTLFLVARYGPRLGELLRDDLERLPFGRPFVRALVEVVGWMAAALSASLLALPAASALLLYFWLGLGFFHTRSLGVTWAIGCATLGPVLFVWLRRRSERPFASLS